MIMLRAFRGTRLMEIVKKHDSGGLLWKRVKLTPTRKQNARKRLHRVWQNEAVLKACSQPAPSRSTDLNARHSTQDSSSGDQL
ncbi:hypothetical protein KSS87_018724 [Heliosperma pusillum]|nr:hypothetical protein KSS87_018724 [Heliosperma pusillum]